MTDRTIDVAVQTLAHFEGLSLPQYETTQAAGMDLQAAVDVAVSLKPGQRDLIPTGFCIALPAGYEAQIRPRSGLAFKHGVTCLNTPGTIDADYRGEIKIILANLGQEVFTIERGMRIAQMLFAPVYQGRLNLVANLDETERGSGGFGSTGVS